MLTNPKLEITLSMFSYTLCKEIFSTFGKSQILAWKCRITHFGKKDFFEKQKPYFFPYGKWLIFPVPHQTDPDSDVTPLPQQNRKKYPPNVKAARRFTKHDDSQPSKQEHS